MSRNSAIEWCDDSWNPIRSRNKATGKIGWHCEHVTEACRNCYAETFNLRLGTGLPYKPGHRDDVEIYLDTDTLIEPLRWKKPRRIFVCSMTDLFADFVPDTAIDATMAAMALCPQHEFILLTKRPVRLRDYMAAPHRKRLIAEQALPISDLLARKAGTWKARLTLDHFSACFAGDGPFPNIIAGPSVHDQASADAMLPPVLEAHLARRCVSVEPLLGPVDLTRLCPHPTKDTALNALTGREVGALGRGSILPRIDWVIVGGESGPGARPMHPDWARSIRDQCATAGVPFFFKQWGAWARWEPEFPARNVDYFGDDGTHGTNPSLRREPMVLVGKKAAGRLLDGRTHDEFP